MPVLFKNFALDVVILDAIVLSEGIMLDAVDRTLEVVDRVEINEELATIELLTNPIFELVGLGKLEEILKVAKLELLDEASINELDRDDDMLEAAELEPADEELAIDEFLTNDTLEGVEVEVVKEATVLTELEVTDTISEVCKVDVADGLVEAIVLELVDEEFSIVVFLTNGALEAVNL